MPSPCLLAPAGGEAESFRPFRRGRKAWFVAMAILLCTFACSRASERNAAESRPQTGPPESIVTLKAAAAPAASSAPVEGRTCPPLGPDALTLPQEHAIFGDVPNVMIEGEGAMKHFATRALAIVRGKDRGRLRIAVYGDSNMTMDFVSGGLRRMLQRKYGDAGHGYVALARPWNWYRHMDVQHDLWEDKWRPLATSTHPIVDGHYGHANMASETVMPGAWASVATAKAGSDGLGKTVSHVDVFYMSRPAGGRFVLKVDGTPGDEVRAESASYEARMTSLDLPDAPHRVSLVSTRAGLRVFGMAFERDIPGFVVDSLGVGALNYEQFLHVSKESRDPMLKARNYDLVVFMLGTNMFAYHMHESWLKDVLAIYKNALPEASILVAGAPDMEKERGAVKSDPRIARVNAQFRGTALANGAAYWDTQKAMGGNDSIRTFARAGLAEADMIHFRKEGGIAMGERLGHALFQVVETTVTLDPSAGCNDAR